MKQLIALLSGVIFALGLGISGMTQTHVVKGFLDLFGSWNVSLMGVMIGAIAINAIVYQIIKKKDHPLLDKKFYLPTNNHIDKNLLMGAAIFGLPGYTLKGVERELSKRHLTKLKAEILLLRLRKSLMDFREATEEERDAVVAAWMAKF